MFTTWEPYYASYKDFTPDRGRYSSIKPLSLSGGTAPLVSSITTLQSGTTSNGDAMSHVPSISTPSAKEPLRSVASAWLKFSGEDSVGPPDDDVVISVPGSTRRIANYSCQSAVLRPKRPVYLMCAMSEYQLYREPSPAVREQGQ